MPAGLLSLIFLIALVLWLRKNIRPKKLRATNVPADEVIDQLLKENIEFFRQLQATEQSAFAARVSRFLHGIRITGVKTDVKDVDRVMIGASAVIPIFRFPTWHYNNLREVLLYPETFNEEFRQEGDGRSVLGMVGSGNMQYVMILSRDALREGFSNKTDKSNTAIHEFVHLVDKTDGEVDGVPEALVNHKLAGPWLRMIHDQVKQIKTGKSDINPYAATNDAEFLAVISEYFFERPDLLESKHPELFAMLTKIFHAER